MAKTGTYLNFNGNAEEAFKFYRSVFGGDFVDGKINRFGEIPPSAGAPPVPEKDKNLVMHISLPVLGGHMLMGSDAPESMGFKVNVGNNVIVSLHPDSKAEAGTLFNKLSAGGKVEQALQDTFWGDYYGSFTDKFGIKWMIDYTPKKD